MEKKSTQISNTYPPILRAKPTESYLEWRRSVEFWIGGEGGQLPKELIGPRMLVQLRDRAAQLVKHLDNKDVSGPDGKDVILRALERSPLIMQLDKHRVDEHRRRLLQLSRAVNESMESYVTRASIYRELSGMGSGLEIGETFFVGHLLDHARLSRRDRAMLKAKAGGEVNEALVTAAMIELAPDGAEVSGGRLRTKHRPQRRRVVDPAWGEPLQAGDEGLGTRHLCSGGHAGGECGGLCWRGGRRVL